MSKSKSKSKSKVSLLLVLLMVFLLTMPSIVYGQADKPTVLSIAKDNYVGGFLLRIQNTTVSQLQSGLTITAKNGGGVDYEVINNAENFYNIKIKNPKLNEYYRVSFSDYFNIPASLNHNLYCWAVSATRSYIEGATFPLRPATNEDFNMAVTLFDSSTGEILRGVNVEDFQIKAFQVDSNLVSSGTLVLKKLDWDLHPGAAIMTANYNKNDFIELEFTVGGVVLTEKKRLVVSAAEDVAEYNNYPQWWLNGGGPSFGNSEKRSLDLSWNAAFDIHGITQYRIKANNEIVATITDDVYRNNSVTGVVYNYTIKDLRLDTHYEITIEAGNSLGLWSQDSLRLSYTTPSEDKKISELTQIGNILGRLWVTVYGTTIEEMQQGLKIYYEQDGAKKYVKYKVNEPLHGQLINGKSELEIVDANVERQYYIEVVQPLSVRDGVNSQLKWNLSAKKSKVFQELVPIQPKINQDFTFIVFLHDGGEGHSVINVKKENFRITALKKGSTEKANGELQLKKVVVGENLDSDGSVTAEELATYYVTASYSDVDSIDIQIAIDGIVLNDKLNGVTIVKGETNSPSTGGGGGGGGGFITPQTPDEKPVDTNIFSTSVDGEKIVKFLKEKIASSNKSTTISFSDLNNHWANTNILIFTNLGVISGYEDESFHPDEKITRAEFATIVSKLFSFESSDKALGFKDVKGHWAYEAIQSLASRGIINGYEDGNFKPDSTITRAEIIAILSRLFDLKKVTKSTDKSFNDIGVTWDSDKIMEAANAGIIEGRNGSVFAPNESSTRAESVTILLRALELNPEIKTALEQLK